uniref:Uncharacterized protein n=1 Tax=Arundo donax TaxID=35708 RepID=A0A0A9DXH8_ARUDO
MICTFLMGLAGGAGLTDDAYTGRPLSGLASTLPTILLPSAPPAASISLEAYLAH